MYSSIIILLSVTSFVFSIKFENDWDTIVSDRIHDAAGGERQDYYLSPFLPQLESAIEVFKNGEPFEQIVTLGANCLAKFRALEYKKSNGRIETWSHLFDWMVVMNYTALGKAVENDFNDVFGLQYLKVASASWDSSIPVLYNEKYQFQFNHAFDGLNEISYSQLSNKLTTASFHKYFHLIEKKFEYLSEKSRKAINTTKKTLYLSYSVGPSDINGNRHEDFVSMLRSIKSKRNNNFLYLVLVTEEMARMNIYDFDELIEGNLVFHLVRDFHLNLWSGPECSAQWNDILDVVLNLK